MSPLALVLLLAALQGVTEYLPVSSSGHLVLARSFLPGGDALATDAALEVWLHLGTVLAVCVYYRASIARLALGILGRGAHPKEQRHEAAMLVLASLPAAIVGIGFQHQVEALFAGPLPAASALLLTGLVLAVSPKLGGSERRLRNMSVAVALMVGLVQALAIMPGISRSGMTIVAGMALGMTAEAAARFSFLLSIPAIAGAALLKVPQIGESELGATTLGAGLVASFVVGLASLVFLVHIARRRRLHWFAPYCFALGAAGITAVMLGYGPQTAVS